MRWSTEGYDGHCRTTPQASRPDLTQREPARQGDL